MCETKADEIILKRVEVMVDLEVIQRQCGISLCADDSLFNLKTTLKLVSITTDQSGYY